MQQQKKDNLLQIPPRDIDEERLLGYLILGYDVYVIKEKMQILDMNQYEKVIKKLIKEKRITSQEIKEYREKKRKEDKEEILKELKKGTSQREITKTMGYAFSRIRSYVKEIQEEENISDEDIMHWKNEKETSLEKRKTVVLEGLKQGLTRNEIVQKYPKQELKLVDVNNCRIILIKEGIITEEEVIRYRQLREKREKESRLFVLTEIDKQIIKYLKRGYETKEIADLMHRKVNTIYKDIREVKKKGAITEEEIKNARIRRKEQKEKEELEQLEKKREEEKIRARQKCDEFRRKIDIQVKSNTAPSMEETEKIREYIDLCYKIYQKENIAKSELLFLKLALQKVAIDGKDIVKFIRLCVRIEEYKEALNFVRNIRSQIQPSTISKEENRLEILEGSLINASKIQQAIQIIGKGNTDAEVLSSITGLSKDEINILKIKLQRKPIRIFKVSGREKIIALLLQDKNSNAIKRKMQISDLEMDDIEQQVIYRRIEEDKRDREAQIKQDSSIRIAVLYTKLGKKPEDIAKVLEVDIKEVEEKIKNALKVGLIKLNELQGIRPLEYKNLKEEQWQI